MSFRKNIFKASKIVNASKNPQKIGNVNLMNKALVNPINRKQSRYNYSDKQDNPNAKHYTAGWNQTVNVLGTLGAITTLYSLWQNNDDKDIPEVTLLEFNELVGKLKNKYKDSAEFSLIIGSLLDSITASDNKRVEHLLEELKTKKFVFDIEAFKLLVTITAVQGKAGALAVMVKYFGLSKVESIPLAKRLNRHPMKAEIEQLSGQFIKGLGNIKENGERAYLSYSHDKATLGLKKETQPNLFGLDSIDDFSILLAFARSENIRLNGPEKTIDSKYKNTIVVDEFDNAGVEQFFLTLKELSDKTDKPVIGNLITSGSHFTSSDIKIEKVNGEYKATILFFDSLGHAQAGYFNAYIPVIKNVFKHIEISSSESKLQHTAKGCSIFTLLRTIQSINSDNTLSKLEQYQHLSPENRLFDYANQYKTRKSLVIYTHEDDTDKLFHAVEIQDFKPPVFMETAKQSFNYSKDRSDYVYEVIQDKTEVSNENESKFIIHPSTNPVVVSGHTVAIKPTCSLGINVEKAEEAIQTPARYREFSQPVNHRNETADEYIARYTETKTIKNVEKKANIMVEIKAQQYGLRIAQWLSSKSADELQAIKKEHTVEKFKENNLSQNNSSYKPNSKNI